MNKTGLSFGLNLKKKSGTSKPAPPKRKPGFGLDDGSDDEVQKAGDEAISEVDFFSSKPSHSQKQPAKSKNGAPPGPPTLKSKKQPQASEFGDLSSALSSRKYAQEAESLDASVYDYDGVYDSFKPQKRDTEPAGAERKSRYMTDVVKAAEVRERDRSIAELKKIQREREAEGDEFADKEKFVTEAYKRRQEEDRLKEEEEKRREEEVQKKNKLGGMTGFHKQLLEREEQRYAELMKAAEEAKRTGGKKEEPAEEKEKTEADVAREINEKGGSVAINEEGQVVDHRQLLRGGLNVGAKKKAEVDREKEADRRSGTGDHRDQGKGYFGAGGKQAMRERQTRMLEAQLEQALKRTRDEEDEERKKVEEEAKSRKTQADISSAKERYLARKRAAEEAKKNGLEP